MNWLPDSLELIPDVVYGPENTRPYLLDILRPREHPRQPAPAVLFLHGGGWHMFGKYPEINVFLAQVGFVTFSSNYRYSSEATFPAQLEDALLAVLWIRENASSLNLDPHSVGVWGISAGGHLSCLLGALGEVRAAAGICPVTDFFDPFWKLEPWELLGGSVAERPKIASLASPALQVTRGSSPLLLIHGDRDSLVPISQSEKMKLALDNAGVECRLEVVAGGDHFINETHMPLIEGWVLEFFARLRR